ncbi:hypothetical protein Syun_023154 [Stephania yunnanensis]|uniref:Uncharacterized protein n=1 Tax=Stephania yunnanensis TaxID=152371 RepID=A0AAP0HZA6_9MAGN
MKQNKRNASTQLLILALHLEEKLRSFVEYLSSLCMVLIKVDSNKFYLDYTPSHIIHMKPRYKKMKEVKMKEQLPIFFSTNRDLCARFYCFNELLQRNRRSTTQFAAFVVGSALEIYQPSGRRCDTTIEPMYKIFTNISSSSSSLGLDFSIPKSKLTRQRFWRMFQILGGEEWGSGALEEAILERKFRIIVSEFWGPARLSTWSEPKPSLGLVGSWPALPSHGILGKALPCHGRDALSSALALPRDLIRPHKYNNYNNPLAAINTYITTTPHRNLQSIIGHVLYYEDDDYLGWIT